MSGLNILITNWVLRGVCGTEFHARDLALGLKARGHRPIIFTLHPGWLADELGAQGVPVCQDPRETPWTPDVIHAQNTLPATLACLAWPEVPAVFVCHNAVSLQDT